MCKVLQCHQNQESCRKDLSSLIQLLTELPLNLWSNTAMPYEPITSSMSTWAAADMSTGNSQDSLKALGQQLSCFTNGNLEKQTHTAAQAASQTTPPTPPTKKKCFSNPSTRFYAGRVSWALAGQVTLLVHFSENPASCDQDQMLQKVEQFR